MEELYRFVQLRPAALATVDDRQLITTWSDPPSELHLQLRGAGSAERPHVARRHTQSAASRPQLALLRQLDAEIDPAAITATAFAKSVKTLFDRPGAIRTARAAANDFLIAVSLLPELDDEQRNEAHRLAILAAIAQRALPGGRAAGASTTALQDDELRTLLSAAVAILPADLFRPAGDEGGGSVVDGEPPDDGDWRHGRQPRVVDRRTEPDGRTPFEVSRRRALDELGGLIRDPDLSPDVVALVRYPDDVGPRLRPSGAATLPPARLALTSGATNRLTAETRDFLAEVAPGRDNLLEVIEVVELAPPSVEISRAAMTASSPTGGFPAGHGSVRRPDEGLARPPGLGELLTVRRDHSAYRLGAIAHVENVLAGEHRERVHRRLDRTEEMTLIEVEHAEADERDLQTTERFELVAEAGRETSSQSQLQLGVSVSASYGPVSASANFGYTSSTAQSETARQATTKARETVDRAVKRITDRTREVRQRVVLREIEETNRHGIDNDDDANVTGVYRWIDHEQTVGVYSYGTRLMVELHVPEPGAWLRWAGSRGAASGPPPGPPTLPGGAALTSAKQIEPSNYLEIAGRYGAAVSPPPEPYTTVGLALHQEYPSYTPSAETPAYLFYKSDKSLKVKDGYKAVRALGVVYASAWKPDVYLAVGSTHIRDTSAGEAMPVVFNQLLSNEVGDVPVAFTINNAWGYAMTLELVCERTDRALEAWRQATYQTITQAYEEQLSAWDERRQAAEIASGVTVVGRNPLQNRQIERGELKRAGIALMAGTALDAFGAIIEGADGEPLLEMASAVGQSAPIGFYEQAFEWEQAVYVLYPYFWGRHDTWSLGFRDLSDPDPVHAAFLQAGVARTVVPVRPGFEHVALWFLATGQLWGGGKPPQVGDPLYVSIASELIAADQAAIGGTLIGDTWNVLTPTTLVYLQADAELNPNP